MNDISLEDYVAVKPKYATFVPHTAGRYAKKRFRKAQCPIIERCAPALLSVLTLTAPTHVPGRLISSPRA